MRTLQRLCAAFVLTATLALPALAGQIETTFAPPPPPQQSTSQVTTTGQIETTVTGQIETTATSTDPVTQTVLSLLQSVLALF